MILYRQAPDGGLWLASFGVFEGLPGDHGGVARFDGSTWQHYLPGHMVIAMDISTAGSVWLQTWVGDEYVPGLYVITPEAVAARE